MVHGIPALRRPRVLVTWTLWLDRSPSTIVRETPTLVHEVYPGPLATVPRLS